jgi:hypothetical protein
VFKDAKSRGMSAGLWSAFVFMLMIIGLPAYLISRKPKLDTNELDEDVEFEEDTSAKK